MKRMNGPKREMQIDDDDDNETKKEGENSLYFPSGCTFTNTFFFPMTFTTSPT